MIPAPPRPEPGLFIHLGYLLAAATQYFSARLQLLASESKEAGVHYAITAALAVGALFVMILGYVFLVVSIVFAIAAAFDNEHAWIWIMAIAAAAHFGAAYVLALMAYKRVFTAVFPETLAELQKDSTWLNTLTKTP